MWWETLYWTSSSIFIRLRVLFPMSCMTYWKGSYPCVWNICWAISCKHPLSLLMSWIGALTLLTLERWNELTNQEVASVPPNWTLGNLGNQVMNATYHACAQVFLFTCFVSFTFLHYVLLSNIYVHSYRNVVPRPFLTAHCGRPSCRWQCTLVTLSPPPDHHEVHIRSRHFKWHHELCGDPHRGFPVDMAGTVPFKNSDPKNALFAALSWLDGQVRKSLNLIGLNVRTWGIVNLHFSRCGPLIHYWCMRYEAKHSFFKKLSAIIGNYINLPYTLAKRHQHLQCYRMTTPSNFLKKTIKFGKGLYMCNAFDTKYVVWPNLYIPYLKLNYHTYMSQWQLL